MLNSASLSLRFALGVSAALAATATPCLATTSPAPSVARVQKPAPKHMLFRVRGPNGGAVYLLGSVHLLNPEAGKLPPEVDSAFSHASTVAFETNLDSLQMRAAEVMVRGKLPAGVTLRSTLSPASAAKADTLLRAYGLTLEQVAPFKPWFVSAVMTQLVMQRAKFESRFGVDMQINALAKAAGKPIVGLEPVDFQLGLFDSISPEDQERMLTSGAGPDSTVKELLSIKDAWVEGNVARLDSVLSNHTSPTLYAKMITDRNKAWISPIESLLSKKTDALVVVGAAHLVGKDGVLELLKRKGYTVEQM